MDYSKEGKNRGKRGKTSPVFSTYQKKDRLISQASETVIKITLEFSMQKSFPSLIIDGLNNLKNWFRVQGPKFRGSRVRGLEGQGLGVLSLGFRWSGWYRSN
jgi:hypothetical protein